MAFVAAFAAAFAAPWVAAALSGTHVFQTIAMLFAARHLGLSACASENLVVLELDNCPLITDTSLDHLTGCHNLQRIEL